MTPYGEGKKAAKKDQEEQQRQVGAKRQYDFSAETLYYEGAPSRGDLATNLAMLITVFW